MRNHNDHDGTRRRAAGLAMAAAIALLAAGCGGSSSSGSAGSGSTPGRSTAYQQALAYAQCMRTHGVPGEPDPNSSGQFVSTGGSSLPNVPPAVFQAANKVCAHLLPNGGQLTQQQRQQGSAQLLKFAKCMRSHGIPNFPDPPASGELNLKGTGINPQSPQFQSAQRACQSVMPGPPGGSTP